MFKLIKKYLQQRRLKKFLIACELQRLKENYVYRFLLNNYERELKGKVDFGAWWYASEDMKKIKANRCLNKAYDYARKITEGKRIKEITKCPLS